MELHRWVWSGNQTDREPYHHHCPPRVTVGIPKESALRNRITGFIMCVSGEMREGEVGKRLH